ncbi:MAG: winged helix-turn-helix transcriptional regulator [Phyllobacterium sp.]
MSIVSKTEGSEPLLHTTPGFAADITGSCPIREVLDIVGDTWSLLVILNLQAQPLRFNALKREIEGISQRMLTVTLRSLEKYGLVRRTVKPASPPEVTYTLTETGHSIAVPIAALGNWAASNRAVLMAAKADYDSDHETRPGIFGT